MRYRMSVIYGHPVIATRALRFADHVTKRNGGSGDENGNDLKGLATATNRSSTRLHKFASDAYPKSNPVKFISSDNTPWESHPLVNP